MQQSLKFILFALILISILYHPAFAQEGGGGSSENNNSGEDRGGTGDHCVGDRGRDECRPDPNPPCTDYLGSLPPELAFFEPSTKTACQAGQTATGYTYKICKDTCDNSLWLQNHGPICTTSVTTPITPPSEATPLATSHPYICEEINPPPGTVGKQLQLKYLKCGLR